MSNDTEYDTFRAMTDYIQMASSCARQMMRHRPDQARQWEAVAMSWDVARQAIFQLEADRVGGKN